MDALRLIESCYSEASDDQSWGITLASVLSGMVGNSTVGVLCTTYRIDPSDGLQHLTLAGDARYMGDSHRHSTLAFTAELNRSSERNSFLRATYGASSPRVAALSEMPRREQAPLRQHLPWPQGDTMGLFGSLDGVHGFMLSTGGPESQVPRPRRRTELVRLSEHLAVGYWLRRLGHGSSRGADPVAVYTPRGRRLDRARPAGDRTLEARLVDAVRQMDRARCRHRKHAPEEATNLWQALVAGRYALVESFERGGRRVIVAVSCRSPRPALTPREAAVARAAALGMSNKLIGAALGISASTIGVHLGAALRKLGCPNRLLLNTWLRSA